MVYAAARLRGGEVLRLAFPEDDLSRWEAPFRRLTLALSILAGLLVGALLIRSRSRHAAELGLVREAAVAAARGERPAYAGPVSEETAIVFSALGELADRAADRDARQRRSDTLHQTVFEAVPAGLLVADARLSLLAANGEAIRLLGAPPDSLRPGEHVLELARERSVSAFLEGALGGKALAATLALPPERGGRVLEARAVPIPGGGPPGQAALVVLLRDTSPAS
jgi:PAS domain-containing protein